VPLPKARSAVLLAFAAVYIIWGSTYLAIRYAIDTLPPLLMAGVRFFVAGAALWFLAPGDRNARPTGRDWRWAFVLGGLLLLGGNGIVSLVEAKMPTGITALLVTSVPLWMVLLDWARPGGRRPHGLVALGLVAGFAGVALLAGSDAGWRGGKADLGFVALLLFGTLCWALGSLLSRGARIKLPILRSVALQMIAGGLLLSLAGLLRGEWAQVDLAHASLVSLAAWLYLVVFGSIIAFSAYSWLLTVRPAAAVSTYAFVNPVVAVLLGSLFLQEPLGPRDLAASALIVAAVALVIYAKSRPAPAAPAGAATPAK
jgi:drug/metabolite transporter (DMT)-like permease